MINSRLIFPVSSVAGICLSMRFIGKYFGHLYGHNAQHAWMYQPFSRIPIDKAIFKKLLKHGPEGIPPLFPLYGREQRDNTFE